MRIPNDTTYILHQKHYTYICLIGTCKLLFFSEDILCALHICDRTQTHCKQKMTKKSESAHKCNALAKTDSICAFKNQDVNMHIAHSYHHIIMINARTHSISFSANKLYLMMEYSFSNIYGVKNTWNPCYDTLADVNGKTPVSIFVFQIEDMKKRTYFPHFCAVFN